MRKLILEEEAALSIVRWPRELTLRTIWYWETQTWFLQGNRHLLLETASDDWFADCNEDGLAEMSIGRLPAEQQKEAARLIQKIISYERRTPSEEILLSADANDGYDFEADSNKLALLVPPSIKVNQVNRGRVGTETAKQNLLDGIHRGQKLVNYTGHGSFDQWRANLPDNDAARALTNERLPVFVMMTCLNGYFHDAAIDSLAESLLKAEHGGAVAVWASSGMTLPVEQALMNQELYRLVFSYPSITLGEAASRAKLVVSEADVRRTWVPIGDPTMKLKEENCESERLSLRRRGLCKTVASLRRKPNATHEVGKSRV